MSGDPKAEAPAVLVLTFDPPIHFSGKDYAEVTLREPTSQEFADASDFQGIRSVIHLVHAIGKIPKAVAGLVPVSKSMEADRFFAGFNAPARPTPNG